jgi:hypothetical protein
LLAHRAFDKVILHLPRAMIIRARLALPSILALLTAAHGARAEDIELGKFAAAIENPAPSETRPASVPQQNPPPAEPADSKPAGPNESDRAKANAILSDCNDIATATNLWAQEKKKSPKTRVTLRDIVPYLKPDSPVVTSGGNDRLGNPYDFGTADAGPYVSPNTVRDLSMPTDFWGDYAPRGSQVNATNGPSTASNSDAGNDPSEEPGTSKPSSSHTPSHHRSSSSQPQEKSFGRKFKDFFKGR